jgi:site-specific recombinase XerC
VPAIPTKRHDRAIVSHRDERETAARLAAPDQTRLIGRRDHALMNLTIQTGRRVSELTALRCQDAHLARAAHVQVTGKGRELPAVRSGGDCGRLLPALIVGGVRFGVVATVGQGREPDGDL